MRRFFLLSLSLCISMIAVAQSYKVDLDATLLKNFEDFKKGSKVNISKVVHDVVEVKGYSGKFDDDRKDC